MLFTKMEATGNDFIIIEATDGERSWPKMAVAMCDRHRGIGADGILVASASSSADVRMGMFNPDGSEAEMCGNGIRCFARYILSRDRTGRERTSLAIETKAGVKKVVPFYNQDEMTAIKVDMGKPVFSPSRIPVLLKNTKPEKRSAPPIMDFPVMLGKRKLLMTFVSMGNPHAVCFTRSDPDTFPLAEIGPRVERHEMFPKRVNFEIAQVINQRKIRARVWERGAGATLSCGTGACAVGVAAILHGYTETTLEVELPGGPLEIEWNGKDEVYLKGPADFVFKGEWIKRN